MSILGPNRARRSLVFALAAAVALCATATRLPARAAARGAATGVLYVGSNDPTTGQNSVLAYSRAADGSLTPLDGSPFLTGGTGTANAEQKLGPDDVDKGIAVNADHSLLFAANSGSNTVAVFRIGDDGGLTAAAGSPFDSGGVQPVSLAAVGKLLFVTNKNQDPEQGESDTAPNVSVFKVSKKGKLKAVPKATVEQPAGSSPAGLLVAPSGDVLFAVNFGVNVFDPEQFSHLASSVESYTFKKNGKLTAASVTPAAVPATPPIALGLLAHPTERVLYVGFPAAKMVGVYTYDDAGALTYVRSAANSGALVCWFVMNGDATFFYTSNNGDDSVSVYDVSDATTPVEAQRLALAKDRATPSSPVELTLDPSGEHLFVVGQRHTLDATLEGGNVVHVLDVGADGKLTEAAFSPVALPIPVGAHPHGIVTF